jgi:hypothetical protein
LVLQQVAVGGVDLDAVEAGFLGALGGMCVVGDDAGDFRRLQRARRDERLEAFVGVGLLVLGPHGARRHGQRAIGLQVGMRNAPDVPELQEDASALLAHCLGRELPAFDLLLRPDARGADVALTLGGDVGCLGDDEAGRGALGVVGRLQLARYAIVIGTRARQRRHDDAVGEGVGAEPNRVEEIGLGGKGGNGLRHRCLR